MVKRSDYPQDAVEMCLSVLVEFMTIVGAYKDDVEERARIHRDVFERVNAFLDELSVRSFSVAEFPL